MLLDWPNTTCFTCFGCILLSTLCATVVGSSSNSNRANQHLELPGSCGKNYLSRCCLGVVLPSSHLSGVGVRVPLPCTLLVDGVLASSPTDLGTPSQFMNTTSSRGWVSLSVPLLRRVINPSKMTMCRRRKS